MDAGATAAQLALLSSARTSIGAGAIATALGLSAADLGGGGGGGGGLGGLLGAGGWGSGILGFAGFGSVLSLMGAGFEHVLTTAIGVMTSAVEGAMGGLLLGGAATGVAGVGMGTDLAGIGQAAGDIKTVYTDLGSLNTAIAEYGQNSSQAAAAQQQLNSDLAGFSPVAQGAVLAAANTIVQFKTLFDTFTGPAEKIGAQIIQSLAQTAEAFLPTIGMFAAQNMGIIQQGLQPLLQWATGPGLDIFTNLEDIFQKNLPYAMSAFDNAIEVVGKSINFLATNYLGGVIPKIAAFFEELNSPAGFAKWETIMSGLVSNFDTWVSFLGTLGKTIYDVFAPAVGVGQDLIRVVTSLLKDIDAFATSPAMANARHQLFDVHMQEVIQGIGGVLKAVLPFAEQFALAFVQLSTVGAAIATAILKPLADIISLLGHIPGLTGLVADFLLLAWVGPKIFTLELAFAGLIPAIGGLVAPVIEATGAMFGLDLALDANPVGAITLGVIALTAALIQLSNSGFKTSSTGLWGQINRAVDTATKGVTNFGVTAAKDLVNLVSPIPAVDHAFSTAANVVGGFINRTLGLGGSSAPVKQATGSMVQLAYVTKTGAVAYQEIAANTFGFLSALNQANTSQGQAAVGFLRISRRPQRHQPRAERRQLGHDPVQQHFAVLERHPTERRVGRPSGAAGPHHFERFDRRHERVGRHQPGFGHPPAEHRVLRRGPDPPVDAGLGAAGRDHPADHLEGGKLGRPAQRHAPGVGLHPGANRRRRPAVRYFGADHLEGGQGPVAGLR